MMGTNNTYNGAYSSNPNANDSWNMDAGGGNKEDLTWLL